MGFIYSNMYKVIINIEAWQVVVVPELLLFFCPFPLFFGFGSGVGKSIPKNSSSSKIFSRTASVYSTIADVWNSRILDCLVFAVIIDLDVGFKEVFSVVVAEVVCPRKGLNTEKSLN